MNKITIDITVCSTEREKKIQEREKKVVKMKATILSNPLDEHDTARLLFDIEQAINSCGRYQAWIFPKDD